MSEPTPNSPHTPSTDSAEYQVIARRFRPQVFSDLVGQQHVTQALANAITTGRVGHAYLFTGARGVGKTSAARILAKALDCDRGLSPTPCNECDICQSVSTGEDVDVLEIDGASNRGIDEIRLLRQNAAVRPSRARFKIYIIDEVHMLTREAFNALLKTLEEPPEHVKFIFCTTEPTKLPVTILSRCQRFDFAGIQLESITECLRKIVDAEGVEADEEALRLLARRAAGSMRDGQSLLEQLLAFAPGRITIDDVHGMLGTAGDERLTQLVAHLVDRDAAAALRMLDEAIGKGVDVGLVVEQLFGYLRDAMAVGVGCSPDELLHTGPDAHKPLGEAAGRLGLETLLAAMQILDHTLARMRYSTQARILAELALVRICHLQNLDELPTLIARLRSGAPAQSRSSPPRSGPVAARAGSRSPGSPATGRGGNPRDPGATPIAPSATPGEGSPAAAKMPLTTETAAAVWAAALAKMPAMVAEAGGEFEHIAISAPNRLVVSFRGTYTFQKSLCEKPEHTARFEKVLAQLTGKPVQVAFISSDASQGVETQTEPEKSLSPQQRVRQAGQHPMVRRAAELFQAHPTRVDPPTHK